MMSPELQALVRDEVRRHMSVILAGIAGKNDQEKEDIDNLYPGMPTNEDRPIMHPFGMVSRAKKGTVQVVGRHGEHVGNWLVLGHRDKDRPSDLKEGETILYNTEYKTYIRLYKDGFEIEANGVKLLEELINLVTTIINARTNTVFGPQPLIPDPSFITLGQDWVQIKLKLTEMKGST